MKIVFLGSSHGVPEPNRKCACAMIEVQGRYYFVDMGVMAITDLVTRGIPVDAVKGVFLTHMHGDHINGLVQMADLITWYFKTPDPVIVLPDTRAKEIIDDWLDVTMNGKKQTLRYEKTAPGVVFDDGVLKVTAYPTQHCPNSFAYLAEAEGKRVLFTGDVAKDLRDLAVIFSAYEFDAVVCEFTHFRPEAAMEVLCSAKTGVMIFNHICGFEGERPAWIEAHRNEFPFPVVAATDGAVFEI